jgi:micrococcal nuclease
MFEYAAKVLRVVDGDTVHLDVDLGFDVRRQDSFRFLGINAPEHGTPEGDAATTFLKTLIAPGDVITIRTQKDHREKFGRYLATLFVGDKNINEALVASGHAVPYDGGKR